MPQAATRTNASAGPGSGAGGGFGGGAMGGGAGNQNQAKPTTVSASAPALLSGTTLLVPSKDGTLLAFDTTLGVDLTAPKVSMRFPNPGDQVSPKAPLQLWFRIEDEASGVRDDSLVIDIDGVKMDAKLDRSGLAVVRFSVGGKNRLLSDGRKLITVTVSDWLGNVRKSTFYLTIDNTLNPVKLPGATDPANGAGGAGPGFGGGFGGGKGGGG